METILNSPVMACNIKQPITEDAYKNLLNIYGVRYEVRKMGDTSSYTAYVKIGYKQHAGMYDIDQSWVGQSYEMPMVLTVFNKGEFAYQNIKGDDFSSACPSFRFLEPLLDSTEWKVTKRVRSNEGYIGFDQFVLTNDSKKIMAIYKPTLLSFRRNTENIQNGKDIVAFIKSFGFDRTIQALETLNAGTKDMLKTERLKIDTLQGMYEFDLFAYSYYIEYLSNINKNYEFQLREKIVDRFVRIYPKVIEPYFALPTIQAVVKFVNDKIDANILEIKRLKTDINYTSTYFFGSFYMYQMMEVQSIKEAIKSILEKNIQDFKIYFNNGIIKMLDANSKNLCNYVK